MAVVEGMLVAVGAGVALGRAVSGMLVETGESITGLQATKIRQKSRKDNFLFLIKIKSKIDRIQVDFRGHFVKGAAIKVSHHFTLLSRVAELYQFHKAENKP